MTTSSLRAAALVISLASAGVIVAADAGKPAPDPAKVAAAFRGAPQIKSPERAPLLAATRAGKRVVAVGDYGIVSLTDDGKSFRQAKSVPTRAVLTSVFFLDDKTGWAAGHDGTVLGTGDGGENWTVLREEPGKDRVLLSVWFENAQHGFAVGQFGLVVETDDGGKTWKERRLVEQGEAGDKHLLQIFAGKEGRVFVAAEAGAVFTSGDAGRNWQVTQTDNKGSFWAGVVLKDGSAIVGGMRGHLYRSEDAGRSWTKLPAVTQQSLTAGIEHDDGRVEFVGMGGANLLSKDQGRSFESKQRADRANQTAIAAAPGGNLYYTLFGMVPAQ